MREIDEDEPYEKIFPAAPVFDDGSSLLELAYAFIPPCFKGYRRYSHD